MDKIVKKILNKIEKNGFEAYVVGGYVRDSIINKKTFDIDICTNAVPREIKSIFPFSHIGEYGNASFKFNKYNIEITTYRKEYHYFKRHPQKIEYINNLVEDLYRRDFTINTICMNQKGVVIDLLNGSHDLKNGNIKMIGNPFTRLNEDPLRILRAIRFATILNFKIDEELKKAIEMNKSEILKISKNRIKEELDKIFISIDALQGIALLKQFGIFETLGINFSKIVKVKTLIGMWSQLDFSADFPFTKEDRNNIIKVKEIVRGNIIDKKVLFNYGLYLSIVAGEVLGVDKVLINKTYKSLPIYSSNDLALSTNEIKKILNVKEGKLLGDVIKRIVCEILNENLKNNKKNLRKYLEKIKEEI